MRRTEIVRNDRAIFRAEQAKSYVCPWCHRWIHSQYEGALQPFVRCNGPGDHVLTWEEGTTPDVQPEEA